MSIRVGKYNLENKKQPSTNNYTNILIHTTGQLSPFVMKDDNGIIMENWWQFHKIWPIVGPTKQTISPYDKNIRWTTNKERHYVDNVITPDYWEWREKGLHHHYWVRYPAGYTKHDTAIGSVIGNNDNWEIIDYITARKVLYFDKYREIAIKTNRFKTLLKKIQRGENIQINEVDGPTWARDYPYSLVENESIEITQPILQELINNPTQPFGHGYSLAACLLGIESFD